MVTDEEKGPTVREIDLHTDESIGVPREVVQGYALAEIHDAVIEGFPV
jgi:hypothetical protein